MKKTTLFLFLIILISGFLRIYNLNSFPTGLNADEAAIGYNAYSLLQTGKDEYGEVLPLSFKSFGDYKPGLYFYFVLPFVAIFGLNEWAVRLPSALFGIATIVLVFFLSRKIFKNELVALISALFLAISPWHLHFSRGGWETNAATFFITLGIYLLIKALENSKWLFFSLFSFLLSMYTYQSPRLIVPVLLILVVFFYKKQVLKKIKDNFKNVVLVFLGLLILSIPLILQFTSNQATARFTGLSIFSDKGPSSRVNELRGHHSENFITVNLLHNKITAYAPNFLGHYLDHFNPDFLFINGDPLIRNKVPETGQFYLVQSFLLILGLFFLVKSKIEYKGLIIIWLLIAPLASAITYQTPHALRALNMVIPLTLIMAYGLGNLIDILSKKWKLILIIVVSLFLGYETYHYLESYYIHYPKRYPLSWEYGFSEMVTKLHKYENNYDNIVITDRYDQPYILVLFYKKYDPKKYQPQAKLSERDKFNFGTVKSFDNYQFRSINPEEISKNPNTLYIGTETEIPENANILDKVDFPNGKPAFIFVGTK